MNREKKKRETVNRVCNLVFALILFIGLVACGQGSGQTSEAGAASTWQEQYDLGVRYLSEGNYEEAIIAFAAAIEIDPKQPDAYLKASEAYMEMEDTEKAISILEEGLAETDSEEIQNRLDEIMSANDSVDREEVSQFPLTYQILDSGGIVPEVEDIYYEVHTIDGKIEREINTYTSTRINGTNEITLFGEVIVELLPQQYSGSYYISTYFSEDEASQRVEDCSHYIYGIESGQFSNYEELLQIYGNIDWAGGNSSLWIDSDEWYIGVQVFDAAGDRIGYIFFDLGTDEEIQNIKDFGMLHIS